MKITEKTKALLGLHGLSPAQATGDGIPMRAQWSELLEGRNALNRAMRSILNQAEKETRDLTAEERDAFDYAQTMRDSQQKEIDRREEAGTKEPRRFGGSGPAAGSAARAYGDVDRTLLRPSDSVAALFANSTSAGSPGLGQLLKASVTGDWSGMEQYRAQSIGDNTSGGFMVPDQLSGRVIDLSRAKARVIEAGATTIPVTGPTTFATVERDITPAWRGENEQIPESDMLLGSRVFTPQTLAALVRCSVELLEDAPNIQSLIESSFSAQFGLQLDAMCLTGNGVGRPLGLLNTPGVNILAATAGDGDVLTSYAKLSKAVEMVRANNAEPGAFLMASRTSGELDRLVDTTGQPLVPPKSVADRAFLVTNQVPVNLTVGASNNAAPIFTGQWEDYYIAIRTSLVLEASRVAAGAFEKLQVMIRGYLRADGFAVRPNHFAAITGIIPPA